MKKNIVPNINKGIQSLGQIVVENTSPHDGTTSSSVDIKDYMETSEAALQTTDSLRQNVKSISFGIRDLSTRKIHEASNYWKENLLEAIRQNITTPSNVLPLHHKQTFPPII